MNNAKTGAALLWRSGVLFVLDRKPSPDGRHDVTVYDRSLNTELPFTLFGRQYRIDLDWLEFGAGGATSILGTYPDGEKERITFEDAERVTREGYFWYNCYTGEVSGLLELPMSP